MHTGLDFDVKRGREKGEDVEARHKAMRGERRETGKKRVKSEGKRVGREWEADGVPCLMFALLLLPPLALVLQLTVPGHRRRRPVCLSTASEDQLSLLSMPNFLAFFPSLSLSLPLISYSRSPVTACRADMTNGFIVTCASPCDGQHNGNMQKRFTTHTHSLPHYVLLFLADP